ncbi:MAG: hypothetical protein WDN49_12230 [Acetobacteraceae bacterium]
MIYWPITDAIPPQAAITALNDFMRDGGIVVIDSRGQCGIPARGGGGPGRAAAHPRSPPTTCCPARSTC